jgi:GLPGLI family protein
MKNLISVAFFILCSIITGYSQDFEGIITYEITYKNLPDEMKAMLPEENPQSKFYIKDSKTKMEMNMMGAKMIMISDLSTNTSISYTSVMGQKIKSTAPIEEVEGLKIRLVDGETKEIAGYLCKKAIITQPGSLDMEVFYTEDLQSNAFASMLSQFKKLEGIPLEYQINEQEMIMIASAKEIVKKSLDNSVFDPPLGEYKEAPKMPKF